MPRMENMRPAGTMMENSWTSWSASRRHACNNAREINQSEYIDIANFFLGSTRKIVPFFFFSSSIKVYISLHVSLLLTSRPRTPTSPPISPRITRQVARQIGLGGKVNYYYQRGKKGKKKGTSLFYRYDALIFSDVDVASQT